MLDLSTEKRWWSNELPRIVVVIKVSGLPNIVLGFTDSEIDLAFETFWLPKGLPTTEVQIWYDLELKGIRKFNPGSQSFKPFRLAPILCKAS